MDHHITRLDRIKAQARQDAARYSDVNAACPYPFISPAGAAYKAEFERARSEQRAQPEPAEEAIADEMPWCTCNDQPSIEEMDWNKCAACGKPFHL